MKARILLWVILLTISSCKKEAVVGKHQMDDFFNLKLFIEQEVQRLEKNSCSIYKSGEINGVSDQKSIPSQNFNWENEFQILADMDIRKSSWLDYFTIDTTQTVNEDFGEVSVIKYHTNNTKIPIKDIEIIFSLKDFNKPILIKTKRVSNNWIFKSKQEVQYHIGIGLQAEGYEKILWLKEKYFNITSIYKCHS